MELVVRFVVEALDGGPLDRAVHALDLAVGPRATGSVAPGELGARRKRILEPHRAFIAERLQETPHLTLHGLKEELASRGVQVSHNAVWVFLRREGLRFKKTLFGSLAYARAVLDKWRQDYNTERPHSKLGWQTPAAYAATFRPRGDLALRCAKGSAPDPLASIPPTANSTRSNELTTG